MLKREAVEAEEERLREAAAALPDDKRRTFYREVKRELKDPDTYAVLNWFFLVGLHHFYLRRWGRGVLDLGLVLLGIVLLVMQQLVAGVALILLVAIVELWALVRSQVIVQDWNNQVYRQALRRFGPYGNDGSRS
ncbi:TM2 domain-containing protein [Ectothiorhodospiraceae bacterium WFHF3C12]|nr:TM2 domain-containing protein [Ectothiorhodospiraceae bacterium WFHF3C12]